MTERTWIVSVAVATILAGGWIAATRRGPVLLLRSAHAEPASLVPPGTVVVTASGKTFHREGCAFVHGPALRLAGAQAVADGFTPCTRCLAR
ncbi:MAG: hypothetical protein H0T71_14730 [Acidobacteria bacterium]|nr:hypothetical protein [Acidobacteriota bacterium]